MNQIWPALAVITPLLLGLLLTAAGLRVRRHSLEVQQQITQTEDVTP